MSLEDDILIENYLRETLSESEKKEFLNRVEIDVDFKKKFLFEKQLFQSLSEEEWSLGNHNQKDVTLYKELFGSEETKDLEKVICNVNNKYQKSKNNRLKWFLSSAATIAVLITIYTLSIKPTSNTEIYAAYIQKTELPSLIERSDTLNDLAKAQDHFENKAYDKALNIFEIEMSNEKIHDATIYLYTGISQLELNQFREAEKTFNLLIQSDLIDAPKGKWYMALLYIKSNNIDKARQLLTEIVNTSSYNSNQAKELLQEL
jgi:hypothetical protein